MKFALELAHRSGVEGVILLKPATPVVHGFEDPRHRRYIGSHTCKALAAAG